MDTQQAEGRQAPKQDRPAETGITYDEKNIPVLANDAQRQSYAEMALRSKFLPRHIQSVTQMLIVLDTCKTLGLPWQLWAKKTYFIGDALALYVEPLLAAATASGKLEYLVIEFADAEGRVKDDTNYIGFKAVGCGVRAKRTDWSKPVFFDYTLEKAKDAGFTNPNYKKHPEDMLMWRAVGRTLKTLFADICGGVLVQGIDDGYVQVLDGKGTPMTSADGSELMQKATPKSLNEMFGKKP